MSYTDLKTSTSRPSPAALSAGRKNEGRGNKVAPKVAVVGAGKFGRRHIATLARLHDIGVCSLVGVVDIAAQQLQRLGDYRYRMETSLSNLLGDVDVVDIVTPASTHHALAKQSLLANKHVIVEKPMTISVEEATEIHRLGIENKKVVGVGHLFRYHGLTQRLKDLIDSGKIGQISLIEGQFLNPNQPRSDVGSILNYSHFIDLCNYLLASFPIEVSTSVFRNNGSPFENDAMTVFDYPHGIQAKLHVGWAGRRKRRYLAVEGALATVTVDYLKQSMEILRGDSESGIAEDTLMLEQGQTTEPLYLELSDFLNCISNGHAPIADSLSGVFSVYLCQRAIQSALERRTLRCEMRDDYLLGLLRSRTESIAVR